MTSHHSGRQEPDPEQTVQHRSPHPRPSTDPPVTRRLEYTPDMLPDVQLYEAKPARSGWWWVILVGGLVLLIAALAVAAVLWVRSTQSTAKALPVPASAVVTPG
ncbi:hypothetical protein MF672_029425 [Actinomadura sp. ATCC 31491]|uniref:Uncharacterized protein n=1 Tax=Actinomadura luzonensis TaxID=2805427 RepID=A0ABT0FZV5_9ACTN|nr:hypothetical protein [Actinomadura luzonensis]MCK2217886.1 hypothetical protein [Actinomadura luzonensis]